MHEYSIVEALIDRVEVEARTRHAVAVVGLAVRIGALSGVDPTLVASAYELSRPGTVCANAPLQVSSVAPRWECVACSRPLASNGPLRCSACDQPARLVEGDEILLERVDMEVA